MPSTIFYSWQSDLPNKTNRGFIEDALGKAIAQLNKNVEVYDAERGDGVKLDKDTKDLPGSPAIVQAIFEKISAAKVFVSDVTFVGKTENGRPIPNPNVLIEYGWALRELGHSRIISVMNTAHGEPTADTLPFDMRHLRWPIQYCLPASATDEERIKVKLDLTKRFTEQLQAMLRAGLLDATEKTAEEPKCEELLRTWHDDSHAHYIDMYLHHPVRQWPVPANQNHYQLSYLLCRPKRSSSLSHGDFLQALRQTHEEVKKRVWTGWSMFYVFDRDEIKPYIQPGIVAGEDVDVVETNLMNVEGIGLPDYWRMTRTGYATLMRTYREDATTIDKGREALEPGKWFSPRLIVQELTELTAHAAAMFNIFGDCTGAEFRCSWYGLRNRHVADFNPGVLWDHRISKADARTTSARADKETLFDRWPALVAKLANPVTMLFDGIETNEEWVKQIAPEFRKL
jgi:hypothetical protein